MPVVSQFDNINIFFFARAHMQKTYYYASCAPSPHTTTHYAHLCLFRSWFIAYTSFLRTILISHAQTHPNLPTHMKNVPTYSMVAAAAAAAASLSPLPPFQSPNNNKEDVEIETKSKHWWDCPTNTRWRTLNSTQKGENKKNNSKKKNK